MGDTPLDESSSDHEIFEDAADEFTHLTVTPPCPTVDSDVPSIPNTGHTTSRIGEYTVPPDGNRFKDEYQVLPDHTNHAHDTLHLKASDVVRDDTQHEDRHVDTTEHETSHDKSDNDKYDESNDVPIMDEACLGAGVAGDSCADNSQATECDDGASDRDEKASDEERDADYIDEGMLKEKEALMTDDQKQVQKDESQTLKAEGNETFKDGNYIEAISKYSDALRMCPPFFAKERSIMYSNRAASKMKLERYEAAIQDSTKAVELDPNYLKALYRRAELYEKTDKLDEALVDFTKIVEMDSSQHGARAACMRLPQQINDRNEKMKAEMMGKLKDLGNMILRPFGMSTDNFKMTQDPASGGYSVNFVQNQNK